MDIQSDLEARVAQFAPNYYTNVRNPKWANQQHTQITCEVNFKHITHEEWTGFCADPLDYMPYSKEIFERCAAGEFGEVAEYIYTFEDTPQGPGSFMLSEQDMNAKPMPRIIL